MAPHSGQGVDGRIAIPRVEEVDQEQINRLAAQVNEPDADAFRTMEVEDQAREAAHEAPILHALVVFVSDDDSSEKHSGDLVAELLAEDGFLVDAVLTVPPRKSQIRNAIETAVVGGADLVITVGGTGCGPRDKTPEATAKMLDRKIRGISEALRASGLHANSMDAALSRGLAGLSGSTVVVNLASARAAIRDGLAMLGPMVRHVLADLNKMTDE